MNVLAGKRTHDTHGDCCCTHIHGCEVNYYSLPLILTPNTYSCEGQLRTTTQHFSLRFSDISRWSYLNHYPTKADNKKSSQAERGFGGTI